MSEIMHTSDRLLLVSYTGGASVQTFSSELDLVLYFIDNGALGRGIDPNAVGWGSEAHTQAVARVLQHARDVGNSIVKDAGRLKPYDG